MIKKQELRHGNFVLDRSGKILKIDFFENDKICCEQFIGKQKVHPFTEYFSHLQPIPITDEILLELGFEQPNIELTNKEFVIGDFIVYTYKPVNKEVYFGVLGEIKCKYVHHLQNLYLDFTQKELQWNKK